ncbi:hypothetical protein MHLP_00175 [Candidatus Mycoplasma haematolamae str. Purdue]|uniref:Uncharacterized protein n=1 Tax=Mycoplasma haematolamae (strain Purdue) TaxID=1212765 RepID=I7B8R1_MYCHA|nr:hypothetical protein [Candidatus Mycoplasma haematolamae]AFO51615.1 hypothetical protein MHLP_00175 [Candidatus Mycoplasma haematolamae str. Purdue]
MTDLKNPIEVHPEIVVVNGEPITLELEDENTAIQTRKGEVYVKGVNIYGLQKYYRAQERNVKFFLVVFTVFFLACAYFIFVETANLWSWDKVEKASFQWLKTLAGKLYYQIPVSSGFGLFVFLSFLNFCRLGRRKRDICHEHSLCQQKYYPSTLTPLITRKVFSLFAWRLNIFYVGLCLIGLGLLSCIYAHICAGVKNISGTFSMKWYTGQINSECDYDDWMVWGGFFAIGGGLFLLMSSNPFLKYRVWKVLRLFSMSEMTMNEELKSRVFRLNRRNKVIVTVIICIAGAGIYLLIRKFVLSLFSRSFAYSRHR